MQFTPQQLAGGASYRDATRVGNWVEDICLREYQQAHFEEKKRNGSLELQRRRAKLQAGNAPVRPSQSSESILCFGDAVVLDNMGGLRLACDIWDEILPGKGVFSVSAVPSGGRSTTGPDPAARSSFVLIPADGSDFNMDDPTPVAYGAKFRLQSLLAPSEDAVAAGLLAEKPVCYLASTHKSERMASRLSNRQLVFMLGGATPDTVWFFERAVYSQGTESAEDKFFSQGQPVEAGVPLVLVHMPTRVAMLADPKQTEYTDFGSECEVVCQTVVPANVVTAMAREAKGSAVVTVPLESQVNHWVATKV